MPAATPVKPRQMKRAPLADQVGVIVTASAGQSLADLEPAYVMELLRDGGAVMLRGFAADRAAFEDFTRRFASEFILPMMRGARPKVEGAADAKTAHVDVGFHPMGLHQELSFTPMRPEAIWLWCEKTAGSGGETTIADGVKIYAALPDAHKRILETRRLKYVFGGPAEGVAELFETTLAELPATLARHAPDLSYTRNGDQLMFNYLTSALQKTKFSGATAFLNFLLFSQTAEACRHPEAARVMAMMRFDDDEIIPPALVSEIEAIAERFTHPIKWQAGDLVMIDNRRLMHGRRGFESNSQRTVYYRAARRLHPL